MNYDSHLIKKILLEIKKNPKQIDKTIYISGFSYNDIVFPCLLSLHKEKYFNARIEKDESDEPVQILVDNKQNIGNRKKA